MSSELREMLTTYLLRRGAAINLNFRSISGLCCYQENSVLGVSTVSLGGISSCVVDTKLVFATALLAKASGLIVAHNNPSENKRLAIDGR